MERYRISVSRRMCEAVVVISVAGRLDISQVGHLDHKIQRVLATGNLHRLVIDLSKVTFICRGALSTLGRAQDIAFRKGIELRFVTGGGPASALVQNREAAQTFTIDTDVDTACGAIFNP
jgi:anti-anti-sigma factor